MPKRKAVDGLWARIALDVLINPKVRDLEPAAKWLFVAGILTAVRDLSDGFVRAPVVCVDQDVDMELAEVLVAHGLWHRAGHNCPTCPQPEPGRGWVYIHDFLDFQMSRERVEDIRSKLVEAGRRGARKRWEQADPMAKAKADPMANPNGPKHGPAIADIDTDTVAKSVGPSSSASSPSFAEHELAKITDLTGGGPAHARKTAAFILAKAPADLRSPLAYVLAAIRNDPAAYRYRRGNPKTSEDMCPEHVGEWRDACRACAIDARLKQPIGHVEVRETEQGLEVVAQYDEPNWLEDM